MRMTMEQDMRARERILQEIDRNFFVEASAGSGKTTSLVGRMTAMVRAGIDVSHICAITFTKIAAREFYSRFQSQLIQCSRSEQDPEIRERYVTALRNLDLCFMDTIDAFAKRLLDAHPMEADIPSDSILCEGGEERMLMLREYVRMKRGGYSDALLAKYERFQAVQPYPEEVFCSCIRKFADRREAVFDYTPPGDMDVDTRFAAWKAQLVSALKYLNEHPDKLSGVKDVQQHVPMLPGDIRVLSGDWNLRINEVLDKLKKLEKIRLWHDRKCCLAPEEVDDRLHAFFAPHYNASGKLTYYYMNLQDSDAYRYMKELQYAATVDFLVSAAGVFSEHLRSSGKLTFHDAQLCLRDMLRQDAASGGRLIAHISERYRYFLVDEFQDTDPLQSEIIFYLTAQKPCADWKACMPRPGSLFIVGDPKQSIYRFRGADVGAYMRVRRLFEQGGGEILSLCRNFRSTAKLRRWFNMVFPSVLEEIPDVQSGYPAIPVQEDEDDTMSTGIYTYDARSEGKTLTDDAAQVARIVKRFIGNPEICLKDGKPPTYRDIMIITPGKDKTALIADALHACSIPTRVEGKAAFENCPALSAGIAVFEAAANPTDTLMLYRALVSEAFGIKEQTISRFCSIGGVLRLYAEQEEALARFPEIAAAFALLRKHVLAGQRMSTSALFRALMDDIMIFAAAGSEAMEYFCYAVELLRKAEADRTILHHADGAALLRRLLTEKDKERCASLSPDDDRVHIANLHKVKGLEAPIVILAYPLAYPRKPEMGVVHHEEGCICRFFFLNKGFNDKYAETDRLAAEKEAEAVCKYAEAKRNLYVAATRARNYLVIGNSLNDKKKQSENNPWRELLPFAEGDIFTDKGIPDNTVQLPEPAVRTDGEALYAAAAADSILPETFEATYTTVLPSRMKLKIILQDASEAAGQDEGMPEDTAARNAALTGTLVHRLMECLVSGGVPEDAAALAAEILHDFDADETTYRPVLEKVFERMTNGGYPQEQDAPADLLAELREAEEWYCEVPFCQKQSDALVHGVIDLIYRKGEAWHIVDYKTNAEYHQLAEKYAAQLAAYQKAFRELTAQEADARIYHISV